MEYENLDDLLVKLVRKFDNIYDKSNPNFKNKKVRDSSWSSISMMMKKPKEECHQRWNVLRTRYALEKRKSRVENKPSTWTLYDSMTFLNKFMVPRKSYGNYRAISTTSDIPPLCSIWDPRPMSTASSMDPIYIGVEPTDEEVEQKMNFGEIDKEDCTVSSFDAPITAPKCIWGKQEQGFETVDAEYAFGRTIALMLKNIRGHKRRRKAQAEIMQLMCNCDSGSDSE